MMDRLKDVRLAASVGAGFVLFMFSAFATKEYVNDKHSEVIDRLKDIQEAIQRLDERLYNNK